METGWLWLRSSGVRPAPGALHDGAALETVSPGEGVFGAILSFVRFLQSSQGSRSPVIRGIDVAAQDMQGETGHCLFLWSGTLHPGIAQYLEGGLAPGESRCRRRLGRQVVAIFVEVPYAMGRKRRVCSKPKQYGIV